MQKQNDQLFFSPSDLTTYTNSPFASWMDRWKLEFPQDVPKCDAPDELMVSLSRRGRQHELDLLAWFESEGNKVVKVPNDKGYSIDDRKQITIDAMSSGADVIYQAVLECLPFRGFSDFLVKVSEPGNDSDEVRSAFGDYYYEVWDSKLSMVVKPEAIIQLCCYCEMLASIQGVRPASMVVALGNGVKERLKTDEYFFYYLSLKKRLIETQCVFDVSRPPDPADSKNFGRWSDYAQSLLRDRDHLSRVANITRSQIKKLNQADVHTVAGLAGLNKSSYFTIKLNPDLLATLQAQAVIQNKSLDSDGNVIIPPRYQILKAENKTGLVLLPPQADLDVFFDIEGYPLDEGGLEYLWGSSYLESGKLKFRDFWAHNQQEEKQTFIEFIQWVYTRWKQDSLMHIYHYANYEVAACRKLMSRYGVCEFEVDELLRNEVFVDLYKIVKGGLLLGEPRYSIKNVEHLYRGKRDTEVGSGGDSVVVYEYWRQQYASGKEGYTWETSKTLKDIRDYNIDDCNSTYELVVWLRERQLEHKIDFLPPEDKQQTKRESDKAQANREKQQQRIVLRDKLLLQSEGLKSNGKISDANLTENLAWMLEFHWREIKPVYWKYFERIGWNSQELYEDIDCLAGCQRTEREPFKKNPDSKRERSLSYEYKFDNDQEFKAGAKKYYILGELNNKGKDLKVELNREESDFSNGLVVVKTTQEMPDVITMVPDEVIGAQVIEDALFDVVSNYAEGELKNAAITQFLLRSKPKIKGIDLATLSDQPQLRLQQITRVVGGMDDSYLPIQGPPGSGKTYTGKYIIAELVTQGKCIGISSNSHKAINNLLIDVAEYCQQEGIDAQCYCNKDTDERIGRFDISVTDNNKLAGILGSGCVVGTTAWGFCRADMENKLDYLFIDEAGQVSVANLVAMSRSARNLVLMGDQMQLGQPLQGTHPMDSGLSVLDYLLHESPIIPPDMGIFLDTTYRMHSAVNDCVSQLIYEGQLHAHPDNDNRKIECIDSEIEFDISPGVKFVEVVHQGNTQASDEEVDQIILIVKMLLSATYTNKQGEQREITLDDMLFVAPYNHQVNKLRQALERNYDQTAKVGSVDKFQGQQAPIVFFSLCASEASESSRGIDFLFDKHRLNVAISRAQVLVIIVGNPALFHANATSVSQMKKVNVMARLWNMLEE